MNNQELRRRDEQRQSLEVIGAKLRAARELNNMSLAAAAKRLGYRSGSKLSKLENASDTNSIPTYILKRAAQLYGVSMDYLFGLVGDDFDGHSDQQQLHTNHLAAMLEIARQRDMAVMGQLSQRLEVVAQTIDRQSQDLIEVEVALERYMEMHPEFVETRGSRLVGAIQRAGESGRTARTSMRRYKFECEASAACDASQMSLPLASQLASAF